MKIHHVLCNAQRQLSIETMLCVCLGKETVLSVWKYSLRFPDIYESWCDYKTTEYHALKQPEDKPAFYFLGTQTSWTANGFLFHPVYDSGLWKSGML